MPNNKNLTFPITGMHCASCAMSIDGALEDIAGVQSATTSYPKSTTSVTFNSKLIPSEVLQKAIKNLGYTATVTKE
jgi:copper chaperone CopZ